MSSATRAPGGAPVEYPGDVPAKQPFNLTNLTNSWTGFGHKDLCLLRVSNSKFLRNALCIPFVPFSHFFACRFYSPAEAQVGVSGGT